MERLIDAISLVLIRLAAVTGLVSRSAERLGRQANRRVGQKLRQALDAGSYWVFSGLELPGQSGTIKVDHVVVSRFGVFIIETKNFPGWIYGDASQHVWTHRFWRSELPFANPLLENRDRAEALATLLGCDRKLIDTVVVFAGRGHFGSVMPSNVVYADYLAPYIREYRVPVIEQSDVLVFADGLLVHEDETRPLNAGSVSGTLNG